MRTSKSAPRVFAVDPDGSITDHATAKAKDGPARFANYGKYPSVCYLIQRVVSWQHNSIATMRSKPKRFSGGHWCMLRPTQQDS